METYRNGFLIRDWTRQDQAATAKVISTVLAEYGLDWQPQEADQDVLAVEEFYQATGGEFWVIEFQGRVVGTAGYYPVLRGKQAVEIRKMYLLPEIRGQGLGQYLLELLEQAIAAKGFKEIWIETASVLHQAVKLYEQSGYQPATGVETARCDRVYTKFLPSP